jgi:putative transposase
MREVMFLIMYLLTTVARLLGPGGGKAIVAENLLLKQQLIVYSRSRKRAPHLLMRDRMLLGFWTLFLNPRRITRAAIIVKPSTLLKFHAALIRRKYRLLYSARKPGKPGPKGPSQEIIDAIVAMKRRNPRFGCPRIAQQINLAFGLSIDKDVVRRILAKHYRPDPDCIGPSWLTFIGHTKDSLWSIDLFRCESILLKSHWVLVIMDQFTRRIIGFGVHAGDVDGIALCRMFNAAISTRGIPRYLSSDNDPLFKYHRWQANLRILDVKEIKSVPYVPLSHPFVERLIGTIRREYLDHTLFWNASDLKRKLGEFQQYYNSHRVHTALDGRTPSDSSGEAIIHHISPNQYRWKSHCHGLYKLPVAA